MAGGITLAVCPTLAALVISIIHFREKPAEGPVTRLNIPRPGKNRFAGAPPAVSPDGRQVVRSATSNEGLNQLWLRSLDSDGSRSSCRNRKRDISFLVAR